MKLKSLVNCKLQADEAILTTSIAAGFNSAGFCLYILARHGDGIPLWAPLTSITVGLLILIALKIKAARVTSRGAEWIFAANVLSVAGALIVINQYSVLYTPNWIPFRAAQLGCLFAAMVAPSFISGFFAIITHTGVPVVQYLLFTEAIRDNLSKVGVLTPIFAFGLAAVFILVLRFRTRILRNEYRQALVEAAISKVIAEKFISIRDMMNTPLQTLTASLALMDRSGGQLDLIERCERALQRLEQLNHILKPNETEEAILSLDAESSIKRS